MTPAQQLRGIIESIGWNVSEAARRLMVHRVSMHRYLAQARLDDGGTFDGEAHRQPSVGTVRLAELVADEEEY